MRPIRLELEGFGSFRERTIVDFEGADLFVLSGPTGSGKSTVIDGITFALYGAISRYQKSNLVRPVISNGREEARVRLDFEVGDQTVTAVRVVRRTTTGASTREARLVRGEEVLAGNADEVSEHVERLLGLSFEHFQKCVVLPQGAFAQLLHDAHANRLALLRSLLDIEVFSRMRTLANGRADRAKHEAAVLDGRLNNELAGATTEALAAAGERVEVLYALLTGLRADAAKLEELAEAQRVARQTIEATNEAITRLETIVVPEGLDSLADAAARARDELSRSRERMSAANAAISQREAERANLPGREAMEALLRLHEEFEACRETLAEQAREHRKAVEELEIRSRELTEARQAFEAAREHRESVLRDNHAFAAARGLKAGDRCPVCGEILQESPNLESPPEYNEANRTHEAAERAHADALQVEQKARARLLASDEQVENTRKQLAAIEERLAGRPDRLAVEQQLQAIRTADEALSAAREEWAAAQAALQTARDEAGAIGERHAAAIALLDAARDGVGGLGPPGIDRQDVVRSWAALAEWAARARAEQRRQIDERTKHLEQLLGEERTMIRTQIDRCATSGVEVGTAFPLEAAATALARAEDLRATAAKSLETATELRAKRASLAEQEQVATALGRHLRADKFGFEAWYVRQVVEHLTLTASDTLLALSQGQFSLALAENEEFEVVDHTNAETRRHIRTLSGGETFLASLALALALADSIATVATGSTARLDAIFLDEGFGTLDPETLDVVATAMEELAAGGRMVGLVTHVAELAARMPVRYEVRKGPGGSTIERVEG